MTQESVSLTVGVISLLVAVAATWIARSSLSQAERVADRDQKDWKQRKWFDLYFKADEAYDDLDRFQILSPSWNAQQLEWEWNELMRAMRGVHKMAVVFPKNPVIDALLSSTAVFNDQQQAISKDRLSGLFEAVEGVRKKALLNADIL